MRLLHSWTVVTVPYTKDGGRLRVSESVSKLGTSAVDTRFEGEMGGNLLWSVGSTLSQ